MSPQETVERALELSKADGCVVILTESTETNLRWAGNTLTTNGAMRSRTLAVQSVVEGAQGTASGVVERSAVTPDDIEALVRASEQAARDAGPAEDAMPLVEPQADHPGSRGWDAPPAETSVGVFGDVAPALGEAFGRARAEDRLLFGFAEHRMDTVYLGSSTGLRLRHDQPTGKVEVNAKSADYSRSVWEGVATPDFADVDVAALDTSLATRLGWARRRVDLPPGRYETLLPPSTVADLFIYTYFAASSARDADEGRTVFSRRGGGSRIGERLTDVTLTMRSDPDAEGLRCAPFFYTTASGSGMSVFDNGMPSGAVDWIREGTLSELLRSRSWARRSATRPAPFVDNLILEGAGQARSLDEMVAATDRGLLLTCLWYIRQVDPQTFLLTGLTRDGVYLVEHGEVVGEVNNFRFNESPVDLLRRVREVGPTQRCLPREWNDFFTRAAMPPLRIGDFNMSTVSQAS